MNRVKSKVIMILCITLFLMATGYAVFSTNLKITSTGNVTGTWKIYFSSISNGDANGTSAKNTVAPSVSGTTAKMSVDLKMPGDEMTYDLTITNGGNFGGVISNIDAKATGSPAIIFTMEGVKEGDKIPAGESIVMKIKIQYDPTVTSQPSETTKTLNVSIDVIQDTGQSIPGVTPDIDQPLISQLGNKILNDNIAYADNVASPFVTSSSGIDFNKISSDTNGKGLYYTNENTEDEKTTYYFRGDVQNNYVKFGKDKDGNDLYWRIIRINEDGTVRMIYQGTSATATGNNATIGTSGFNTSYNDNAYVGYMYGTPGSSTYALTHANTNDSTIKTYIDNWYSTKTNLSTYVTTHLADSGFCNDRRPWDGTGAGASVTTYGMLIRLDTKASFECPNASNDLFTTSASSKGNKALTNPIGLITADEVVYAGGESSTSNSSYYLYTGSTYWTMSPLSGSSYYGELFVSVVGINDKGELDKITTDIIIGGVRPVVNLQSTVEISDGNGTATNPYVIKNN